MATESSVVGSASRDSLVRFGLTVGVALLVGAVYWQSFSSMAWQWQQGDHAHGLVVLPIAVFLIWRSRSSLAQASIRPSLVGLLAVFALVALWIVARMIAVQALEHLAALALIPASIVAMLGRDLASRMVFPLLFLMFALPVSDALVPSLMHITADISTFLLRLFGIPVYREGQYLTLPGGRFVVAEVCSGVRYLMAGLIVTSLSSYSCFRKPSRRLMFVAGASVILILANGLRAFLVMLIASATDLKYMGGKDHIVFGWLLFAVIIFALLWIGGRYSDAPGESGTEPQQSGAVSAPSQQHTLVLSLALVAGVLIFTMRPLLGELGSISAVVGLGVLLTVAIITIEVWGKTRSTPVPAASTGLAVSSSGLAVVTLAIAGIVAGPQLTSVALSAPGAPMTEPDLGKVAGCFGPTTWQETWRPSMTNAAQELSASYSCGGTTVSVYVAAYANPEPGAELISSANRLFPEDWDPHQSGFVVQRGYNVPPVLEQLVGLPSGDLKTWHWYSIDGQQETSGLAVKARQLWALLRQRPAGGKVVVLSVSGAANDDEATQWLERQAIALQRADP